MVFRRAAFMFQGCLGIAAYDHRRRKAAPAGLEGAESSSSPVSSEASDKNGTIQGRSSPSPSSSSSSLSSSDEGLFGGVGGGDGGGPASSSRVRLSDGRYLAYRERGVPKNDSNYRVIIVHGFGSSKDMKFLASQDLMDELGIYLVLFDRAGYGESDPNPKRTVKTEASDIQELADKLELGARFYVIGVSLGSYPVWSCLKRIPDRLAGVALVVPMVNYNWTSLPLHLIEDDYRRNLSRWTLRVAKHTPRLLHWWLTQKMFPSSSSVIDRNPKFFSDKDLEVLEKNPGFQFVSQSKVRQRVVFDSFRRDFIVAFSKWDFDPLSLMNPYPKDDRSVHIWQGHDDKVVPSKIQRYVSSKLPWIKYHEVPDGGHLLVYDSGVCEAILRSLLLGEDPPLYRPKLVN